MTRLYNLRVKAECRLKNEEQAHVWNAIHLLTAITAVALLTFSKLPLYGVFVGALAMHTVCHLAAEKYGLLNFRIIVEATDSR